MLFGDHLKLLGWLFFATASTRVGYSGIIRLQLDYLGRPLTVLAEILMHANAFIGTLLAIIWLHRLLIGKK